MSDVAEVKEAVELWDRTKHHRDLARSTVEVYVDAARRWVRVVEGLDYEAAAQTRYEQLSWPTGDLSWDELSDQDKAKRIEEVKRIVVAAVGVEKGDE